MNIFRKYTRRSLGKNRSRTLVTIIGIVLSMALLTAVIEGAYSGVQFMVRAEEARAGRWEAFVYDKDEAELKKIMADKEFKEYVSWYDCGTAKLFPKNEGDPYVFIQGIDSSFTDMVPVEILTGRMPQNSSEIILPHNCPEYKDDAILKQGDIINITVGRRVSADGTYLGTGPMTDGEQLKDTSEKTYTVVGTYKRLSNELVSYSCPGYIAITMSSEGPANGCFAALAHPSNAYTFAAELGLGHVGPMGGSSAGISIHSELLNYRGTVRNNRIQQAIYGFALILVVLVSFGSISLIYNSFSISLTERTRQYGILKSVGATKKQLRSSVIYEALVLGSIAIPIGLIVGCAGIGITLYCLRDAFKAFTGTYDVEMKLVLNPVALLIAALVCLAVILIAAWIPAARAVRIQPIDAIRQSADTKIKAREVRTSKLTSKLFGFEGTMAAKNFKRNAKRYRTTVVSLFMSVVLFISASSFCSFLTGSVDGIVSDGTNLDIIIHDYSRKAMKPEVFKETISGVSGIDSWSFAVVAEGGTMYSRDVLSSKTMEMYGESIRDDESINLYSQTVFIDDAEFRQLLSDNRLNEKDFFDTKAPKSLLYNQQIVVRDGKYYSFEPVKSSSLPVSVTLRHIEDDGSYTDLELTAAAIIRNCPNTVSSQQTALVYPYSMYSHVLKDAKNQEKFNGGMELGIMAKDHAKVTKDLKEAFAEKGYSGVYVYDRAEDKNSTRMVISIVNVFAYGFIILISLIALANVFNTISTNIMLRRREFAMLRSIGLSQKGFSKMMNYECIIYGARSLMFGLPAAVLMTYLIWKVTAQAFETGFYLPWRGVVIAVSSVFIVVFATMLYATKRIRKDNTIDALRNENL